MNNSIITKINGVDVSLRNMKLMKQTSDFMSFSGDLYINNEYAGHVINYGDGDDSEIHFEHKEDAMNENMRNSLELVKDEIKKYIYSVVDENKIYYDINVLMDVLAWEGLICGHEKFELEKYSYII